MRDQEQRYYFPKWNVLCTRNDDRFNVINGSWSFTYSEETQQRYFYLDQLFGDSTDKPIKVTKEEFIKMMPNFGYW